MVLYLPFTFKACLHSNEKINLKYYQENRFTQICFQILTNSKERSDVIISKLERFL